VYMNLCKYVRVCIAFENETKVNVKLSLYSTKHYAMKAYGGVDIYIYIYIYIYPRFLGLDTNRR
jgi:hypothetical protein